MSISPMLYSHLQTDLHIGVDFIGDDTVAMVLGDNIFTSNGKAFKGCLENAKNGKGAMVFDS